MPNGDPEHDEMPEVILTVARRQNDKQDALLDSHKRQGVIIAGGYLTTGTLTIAAMDPDHAAPAAAIVLVWSLATSLIAGHIQWLAHRWAASPTIAYLIENYYYEAGHSREVLELRPRRNPRGPVPPQRRHPSQDQEMAAHPGHRRLSSASASS